jgi:malonate transporter and related proteins
MTALFAALAPVFLAILVGWAARASRVVPEAAWAGVNRLVYMILSPTFIFTEILRASLSLEDISFVAAGVAGFAVMAAIGFLLLPIAKGDRSAFASAHQGVVRWNTFVVLAAALALLGPPGSALVALLMGPAIPVVNIVTVAVHARWGEGQNPSLSGIMRSLATNPLIISCVIGITILAVGWKLPQAPMDLLNLIGRGALGVSLMCVGAGLNFASIAARPALMTSAVAIKLLAAPLVFVLLGKLAGLDAFHLSVLAMCGAAPSPPAAYILTREMGGDPRFMAGHITATTLLSAAAIPASLWLASLFG